MIKTRLRGKRLLKSLHKTQKSYKRNWFTGGFAGSDGDFGRSIEGLAAHAKDFAAMA